MQGDENALTTQTHTSQVGSKPGVIFLTLATYSVSPQGNLVAQNTFANWRKYQASAHSKAIDELAIFLWILLAKALRLDCTDFVAL